MTHSTAITVILLKSINQIFTKMKKYKFRISFLIASISIMSVFSNYVTANNNDLSENLSVGEITGKIIESETSEGISDALVIIQANGYYQDVETDANGLYSLKAVPVGTYLLSVYKTGYQTKQITNVLLKARDTKILDVEIQKFSFDIPEVIVIEYTIPLFDPATPHHGGLTGAEMKKIPLRKPQDMAVLSAPGLFQNQQGDIQIRGGRVGSTAYYVDGMRVRNLHGIPAQSIDQMSVITSGIEAKYGDLTGGVIIITTKSFRSF